MKTPKIFLLLMLIASLPELIMAQVINSSEFLDPNPLLFEDRIIRPSNFSQNIHHDISPRLSNMHSFEKADEIVTAEVHKPKKPDRIGPNEYPGYQADDPVIQDEIITSRSSNIPNIELNFSGINRADIAVKYFPPDPNGDVGPNHYFQIVNSEFAIWDKNGIKLLGNLPNKTIWDGFDDGQPFDNKNGVDPIVLYDDNADRWLIGVLIPPSSGCTDSYILVAVSTTSDPTGSYYRYAFTYSGTLPDYEKFGVWHDGFYMTANEFTIPGNWFYGSSVCIFDRNAMINGNTNASMIYFYLGNTHFGLLPADADGTFPPSGTTPHICLALSMTDWNTLEKFTIHANWDTISNSTITIDTLHIAPFLYGHAIHQPETSQSLAVLGSRLMYRLQYRNFESYQALVVNHTVYNSNTGMNGIRWYELRGTGNGFKIYQQGTYMPNDNTHRWMGSIAMNGNGDIALGYSASNGMNVYPSIRFAGQTAGAPMGLGILDIPETNIIVGNNYQTGNNRWGDYSMMTVDPNDDYSFWYTQQYTLGTYQWQTRIARINLATSSCASPSNLSSINMTSTSAELSWTENGSATTWEILVVPAGSDTSGVTPVSVTENPFTYDGLIPNTEYEWYVRVDCGNGDYSEWVGPESFYTLSEGVLFSKCYGGSNYDLAYSMNQTFDGGFIIGGGSQSHTDDVFGNHGDRDYWVVKLNSYFDTIWTKSIGGTRYDEAACIIQTSDSGYIVTGRSDSNDGYVIGNHGLHDCWIVKLNHSGNILWTRSIGGSGEDAAESILELENGGFITVGRSSSNDGDFNGNHGKYDYCISKLDTNGEIVWTRLYGGSENDQATSIVKAIDNGYIVGGKSYSSDGDINENKGNSDIWIVKIDSVGAIKWTKTFGGSEGDRMYKIKSTSDNNYIICGASSSNDGDFNKNYGETDFMLLKINSNGEKLWIQTYGGSKSDRAYDILQTTDNNYFVAGFTKSDDIDILNNKGVTDIWIVKTNPTGSLLKSKTFGGSKSDVATTLLQLPESNLAIAGFTESMNGDVTNNHGASDYWLLKIKRKFYDELTTISLPFTEDWEVEGDTLQVNDTISKDATHYWTFETDHQNEGRVRWGNDAHTSHGGDGAITMDRFPQGAQVKNKAILTLNLSNYTDSENLWLSFAWSDEREQDDDGDEVWVRGSDTDEWVRIYNINPLSGVNGRFNFVSGLDIDATLANANPPQFVSETFQLALGQEGLYFGLWGGITFDDITIYEDTPCGKLEAVVLPFVEDWEANSGTSLINEAIACSYDHAWMFETNIPNQGRARWGTDSYISHSGEGALSLDRNPVGSPVVNKATLTLNMENYIGSGDIWMDFAWTDHQDQDEAGDNVWIRGSVEDDWLVIYNINPMSGVNDRFNYVSRLDIDAKLAVADPPQTLSETFQIRFGQEGSLPMYWGGITFDDIAVYEYSPCGQLDLASLPFSEDWEDYSGTSMINQLVHCDDAYFWMFETDHPLEGRMRWGTDTYLPYEGDGAITLDRYPYGQKTVNKATLTMNLDNYTDSEDLWLSFAWADHRDQDEAGDNVWVRGSLEDDWVVIYNINPLSGVNDQYNLVEDLDIDAVLAAANPSQSVSSSFQIKFGQEGEYFTKWDGISFDNILIEDNPNKAKEIEVENAESDFTVYTDRDHIYIRSFGDAVFEEKQVLVYDLFGRTVINQSVPPGSLSKIQVDPCSCYLVVKVLGKQQVKVEKVFVK